VTHTQEAADAIDGSGSARGLILSLKHLQANASFLVETLDKEHGDAVTAWEGRSRRTGNRPPYFVSWHGTLKNRLFEQTKKGIWI
jgi:hypothetical protein